MYPIAKNLRNCFIDIQYSLSNINIFMYKRDIKPSLYLNIF